MSHPTPARESGAAAASLTRLLRPRRPSPQDAQGLADPARVRRVLVVKLHDQLGDFVLATPAFRALRERFPQARLALVTREFLAPLAVRAPFLDRVWVLPRVAGPRDAAPLLGIASAVAAFRPDLAFVLNSVSRSKTADALAALSRARLVVGRSRVVPGGPPPDGAPDDPFAAALAEPRRDPVYDLDLPVAKTSVHQVERLLDLVRWCGARPSSAALALSPRDDERHEALRAIERAFLPEPAPRRIVGIHPGAANPLKCWPLESFVELGAGLGRSDDEPAGLAVFDSPRERGRGAALCAGLEARGVRAALLPVGGIEWFAALCAELDLLLCNDSGVMHIAAALGVPTVSLHSMGRPPEWAPRSDRAVAFYAPAAIGAIPVGAVLEAARGLLHVTARTPVD